MAERSLCKLCGEPMPCGEEMFNYHGYSGRCPKKHGVASEPAPTLHEPSTKLGLIGCYCRPGQCAAPVVMGRQMLCRDPEKAAMLADAGQISKLDMEREHTKAEPAVERPTERIAEMEKEWMAQTEYLDYTNWLNHKHLELESELSSLRQENERLRNLLKL